MVGCVACCGCYFSYAAFLPIARGVHNLVVPLSIRYIFYVYQPAMLLNGHPFDQNPVS